MQFLLPIRLVSEANRRGHWAKHSGRIASHRLIAKQEMAVRFGHVDERRRELLTRRGPIEITLMRIMGPRAQRMDSDGWVTTCKPLRDGIADALGINDGSALLSWRYGQRRGDKHGVEVKVEAR